MLLQYSLPWSQCQYNNNPAYHIYEMDGIHTNITFHLIDHHNYFFNLIVPNSENTMPNWEYLYSTKVR